ncbi:hypothetical protein J5X84_14875 [Streptosporangiaceae bacterium NEAU-GS5]|nr:hypothetical protein [Streptosporangiaceae bacterium NEAU-GS5]
MRIDDYLRAGRAVAGRYAPGGLVFISGSLVEGIGNVTSDLDVFVVHDGPGEGGVDMGDYSIEIDYTDDVRVDIEIRSADQLTKVVKVIGDCPPDDSAAAATIAFEHLKLAHNVRTALPVTGHARLAELQAAFDWEKLARLLAVRFLGEYNASAEDAVGVIQAGDGETALLNSRRALGCAVDACLAANGATNCEPKWRFAKLRALGDERLLETYRAGELDDGRDLLESSRRRLRLAGDVAQRAIRKLAGDPR